MAKPSRKAIAKRALALVDLTDLSDTSDEKSVGDLCQRAQSPKETDPK